jgi:hypothetical protein
MEVVMRIAVAPFVIALAATLISAPASGAKYCLQGADAGYPGDCSYSTYAQCMATASGTLNDCGINPRYAYKKHQRNYSR